MATARKVTPAASELAAEKEIAVENVDGTGADGTVTKADIEHAVDVVEQAQELAPAATITYPLPTPPDHNAPDPSREELLQELTVARKRIADLEAMVAEARAE